MPLDLSNLPSEPSFVENFQAKRSGVDYLGLRQVNLDLMAACLPGTNNVTRHVRPYSVMCWIYWKFPQLMKQKGQQEPTLDQVRKFREKIESLHLWGHMMAGVRGLPGLDSKIPVPKNGRVALDFKSWLRNASNTSLQAAVQYGPSLSDLGGLGFLSRPKAGFYRTTLLGDSLAEALDHVLQESPAYPMVCDPDNCSAVEEEARSLFNCWRIDKTSAREAEAFSTALYNEESIGRKTLQGERSATIRLVLGILGASDAPLSGINIRDQLAFGTMCDSSDQLSFRQARRWLLLQIRQVHRLALEALMGWVEAQLLSRRTVKPDEIVDHALDTLKRSLSWSDNESVQSIANRICDQLPSLDAYLQLRSTDLAQFDLQKLTERLKVLIEKDGDEICAMAMKTLLFLSQLQAWLENDPVMKGLIGHGGATRVSLKYWFQCVARMSQRPLRNLVDFVFKNLIISQHFAVGTNRYDGVGLRLRMILDEHGLESLARRPWRPAVTPDRLDALLSLMTSCGLARKDSKGFFRSG